MSDALLFDRIRALPEHLKTQVDDYVAFLERKYGVKKEIKERQLGCAKGMFVMAPDFDEPMELVDSKYLKELEEAVSKEKSKK